MDKPRSGLFRRIVSWVMVSSQLLSALEGLALEPQSLAPKSLFSKRLSQGVVRRSLAGHFPKPLKVSRRVTEDIRQFVDVYNRAVKLSHRLSEGAGLWERVEAAATTSNRPILKELYGSLAQPMDQHQSFLRLLRKILWARGIEFDLELAPSDDPRMQNRLLTTEGKKIRVHPEARVGDLVFYFSHEIVHVAGGSEREARRQDAILIQVLKVLTRELRKVSKDAAVKDGIYLEAKADLLELEALDWELDLHTARLEESVEGQTFLKKHGLGRLMDVRQEVVEAMSQAVDSASVEVALDHQGIARICHVLGDASKNLRLRRRLFDERLLRFLVNKAIRFSIRSYMITRHGGEARQEEISRLDAEKLQARVRKNVYRGFLYVLASAVIGGVLPILGKDSLEQFPMFGALFAREFLVALMLTPFLISKKVPNPTFEQVWVIGLLSLFMTGVGDPLYYQGLKLTSPLSAFLIYSTADLFFLAMASRIFFKERLTLTKWLGAILTFLGTSLIAWGEIGHQGGSCLGVLMVLASSLITIVWTVSAKKALRNIHPMVFASITFWAGLPILLAYAKGDFSALASPQLWLWSSLTAFVYLLYYRGLKWISAMTVSVIDATSPIFTAVFSSLQKFKLPSLWEFGSLVLTTFGVLTFVSGVTRQGKEKRKLFESKMDDWRKFGKEVTENLESFMVADEGITQPAFVDVSDLEEDYGFADLIQAMSYYIYGSNIPNVDVFRIIFKKLGDDRALKFLMDAREEVRESLDGGGLKEEERQEKSVLVRAIEAELNRQFSVFQPSRLEQAHSLWPRDGFARAA